MICFINLQAISDFLVPCTKRNFGQTVFNCILKVSCVPSQCFVLISNCREAIIHRWFLAFKAQNCFIFQKYVVFSVAEYHRTITRIICKYLETTLCVECCSHSGYLQYISMKLDPHKRGILPVGGGHGLQVMVAMETSNCVLASQKVNFIKQ